MAVLTESLPAWVTSLLVLVAFVRLAFAYIVLDSLFGLAVTLSYNTVVLVLPPREEYAVSL